MNMTAENATTETEGAATSFDKLQEVQKKVYEPENLESASDYINEVVSICNENGVNPVFNFDPAKELPENYALAVVPLTKRVPERGNVVENVLITVVPSVASLLEDENGLKWIKKQVTDGLIRQVAHAAKSKDNELQSLPFTIEDFVTTSRSSGLAGFNHVASDFITVLKQLGMRFLTKPLFRQLLASASFAASQFSNVTQEQWEVILHKMIESCKSEGIEPGLLEHWLKTRNETEVSVESIDLSSLDELI